MRNQANAKASFFVVLMHTLQAQGTARQTLELLSCTDRGGRGSWSERASRRLDRTEITIGDCK